ncbi:MAG: hypothetical protein KFW07_01230 [Mycoplasmataceae bacterium]|nr:hypothetical protein [Mycoplasmataceae bacterium]
MKRNSTGQGHLTNENGKRFEKVVLDNIIKQLNLYESTILNIECYKNENNSLIVFEQSNFYKYAFSKYDIDYKIKASKKYVADLWLLKNEKDLYLMEVKSQKSAGSTDEKIYGGLMLDLIYKEIFNDDKFTYRKICYVTNDYFEDKKYQTPKDILKRNGIEFYIDKLDINWINKK